MSWAIAEEERLSIYVTEGLSASQIGKKLDKSRNAVIGKVSRLGLELGGGVASEPRLKTQKPVRRPRTVVSGRIARLEIPVISASPPPPPPLSSRSWPPASLLERGSGCAYPLYGAGAETMYCAGETGDATYCPFCRPIMYAPTATATRLRSASRAYLWAAAR